MELAVAIALVLGSILFLGMARRARQNVRSIADYCTYPIHLTPSKLGFTLTATNVSLVTVYVALSATGIVSGLVALWVPVMFCLGLAIFPFFFRRMAVFWRRKQRLPEVVGTLTGSVRLRRFAAIMAVLGFLCFYYVEIWGLALVLRGVVSDSPMFRGIVVLLAAVVPAYVCIAGFRAVVETDKIQIIVALLVSAVLAVACWTLWTMSPEEIGSALTLAGVQNERVEPPPRLWAALGHAWSVLVQFGVTLLFAQLIYYENWHRLEAFYHSRMADLLAEGPGNVAARDEALTERHGAAEATVIREAQVQFWRAAVGLLVFFYIWASLYGVAFFAKGIHLDGSLAMPLVPVVLGNSIVPMSVLVSILVFGLFAAALSTADTYLLCLATTVQEDLLGRPIRAEQVRSSEEWDQLPPVAPGELIVPRSIVLLVGGIVFAGVNAGWDPSKVLSVLFASQNGLLAVLLVGLAGFHVSPLCAGLAMFCPYVLCGVALAYGGTDWGAFLTAWLGVVVIVGSTAFVAVGTRRRKPEVRNA